jgi:hypothetical protein
MANTKPEGWGVVQVVEPLPSKHKVMSSNHSNAKKVKNKIVILATRQAEIRSIKVPKQQIVLETLP